MITKSEALSKLIQTYLEKYVEVCVYWHDPHSVKITIHSMNVTVDEYQWNSLESRWELET